ncbi:extracellular solute-binding protein [Streptomyces sp. AD681]|nr:extracellular solute-binding protein [Streptomyces sp. AD681]MDA5147587.1 extracellular solute-binding protein [Streptomyces sp. AD681]
MAPARWNGSGTAFGGGNLYGMSPISEVQGIYYNKGLLNELGLRPPQSIEDLKKALPVVERAGKQPIMLGNSDQYAATHIFSDLAATEQEPASIRDWIGGKEGTTFVTKGNEKAANTMAEWARKGYFGSGYDGLSNEDAVTRFAKGSDAFFVGGSWNGATLDPEKFGFGPLTTGGAGATASPWHIAASSDVTPAAVAFLAALRTPQSGPEILDTGRLPVVTDGVKGGQQPAEPDPRRAQAHDRRGHTGRLLRLDRHRHARRHGRQAPGGHGRPHQQRRLRQGGPELLERGEADTMSTATRTAGRSPHAAAASGTETRRGHRQRRLSPLAYLNSLSWSSLLYVAPAMAFFAVFVLYPIGVSVWYSFYDYDGLTVARRSAGTTTRPSSPRAIFVPRCCTRLCCCSSTPSCRCASGCFWRAPCPGSGYTD